MIKFEVGERYKVHDSTKGMLVIARSKNKLLVNIDGVDMEKRLSHFTGAEIVWTDDWHVAIAYNKYKG